MTTATFVMPLLGRKVDIVKTTGVANTTTLLAAVPVDHIGILIDEATIDLAKIHSGLLTPALEELRDQLISSSDLYTNAAPDQAVYFSNVNKIPKLSNGKGSVSPAFTISTILQTAGFNVALAMNTNSETDPEADPPPTNRDTGIGFTAAQYLADFIRESLK